MADKDPQKIYLAGRLSYPTWTAEEAFERSKGSTYPAKSVNDAAPGYNILVEEAQFDKLYNFAKDVFLPSRSQLATDHKQYLSPKEVKQLIEQMDVRANGVDTVDFEGVFNLPVKAVSEKSKVLAPEAFASVTVRGNKGTDIELKAIVMDEDELDPPDPNQIKFPVVKDLNQTKHKLRPGYIVTVAGNLYAYHNGKNPGFSLGSNVCIFKAKADEFGGGGAIDEDELFADD